jgi:N6-adenosine-specific RNA methylase IME4
MEPVLSSVIATGGAAIPFAGLPPHHFGAILADPPWRFKTYSDKGRGRAPGYREMSLDEIMALPVASLAKPDSVLFLWGVWAFLPQVLAVIEAWGFEFSTGGFVWLKPQIGLGFWTRQQSEFCLLATRGRPRRLHADVRQGVLEPRREHSRKPDVVAKRIERLVAGPYLELFARSTRPGWSAWGNEAGQFDRQATTSATGGIHAP